MRAAIVPVTSMPQNVGIIVGFSPETDLAPCLEYDIAPCHEYDIAPCLSYDKYSVVYGVNNREVNALKEDHIYLSLESFDYGKLHILILQFMC